ncbi:MAG: hypothetical protein JSS46_11125 [Proteobacteria bacterium]|nr:hypothetical protein [Pseudomonadota bacterium]
MNPARRRIIFAGIAGALLLGLARVLEGPSRPDSAATWGVRGSALSADGADVMRVIAPAILAGALPTEPGARRRALDDTLAGIATAIEGLPPIARDEIGSLFALLAWAPLRWALGGSLASLHAMTVADADALLESLRESRWSKKRAAYDALHQITFAAWYANPVSWPAIGYPGPPVLS